MFREDIDGQPLKVGAAHVLAARNTRRGYQLATKGGSWRLRLATVGKER